MIETITRKQFTVDEYYQMLEVGIIHPDDRLELIEGEIVQMSPMSVKHANCIMFLNEELMYLVRKKATIRPQLPLHVNELSEPEPDLAVIKKTYNQSQQGHPTPNDVYIAIEVSLSTLNYDMNVKVPVYAKNNVAEVWVIDLDKNEVHQFSQPIGEQYKEHIILSKGETIQSKQLSEVSLAINDILDIES
jgi:Uma2 family endonuclease